MDSKGQASAEYLLLILVILIIMGTVTIPLVGNSIGSTTATSQVSDAKTAVSTVANAVNIVYANGPGAKRTVTVYIPQDTTLTFDADNQVMGMNINYYDGTVGGVEKTVSKYVNATVPYKIGIVNPKLSKGWYDVTITWNKSSDPLTVTCVPS